MNINKLERKYGRYAIPNLSLVIIAAYILGYILEIVSPNALSLLYLDPYMILHGQVWRVISWILVPPYQLGLFTIINLFFFYSIGRTLESLWGDFRYNLYVFFGLIMVLVGVFALYLLGKYTGLFCPDPSFCAEYSARISYFVSTYYINISVILAFAMTIPDMQVLFWFIIPVKMKWLAYIEGAFLLFDFIMLPYWPGRIIMIISLLNFFVFYFGSRKAARAGGFRRGNSPFAKAGGNSNSRFRGSSNSAATMRDGSVITRHKCAICGKTEKDDPNIAFRFCSKCNGNYEYCQDHLFTHEHIV